MSQTNVVEPIDHEHSQSEQSGSRQSGTICICGRPIKPIHCPSCGSTNNYAKDANALATVIGGKKVVARGFKCRRCATEYNEAFECSAPPRYEHLRTAGAETKRIAQASVEVADALAQSGGDRLALLNKMFEDRKKKEKGE